MAETVNPNNEPVQETGKATGSAELEARIKALEAEREKLKQSITNASADASTWKKKYQETLSEQDKAKIQQDEANAALQKELEGLRRERNIANYTAALGGSDIGMDAETAKAVAEALDSGETDKVFDGIRRFIASHDKALAEKAILENPKLQGGSVTKTVSREEFDQMGYTEMVRFKAENPELYAEYMKS